MERTQKKIQATKVNYIVKIAHKGTAHNQKHGENIKDQQKEEGIPQRDDQGRFVSGQQGQQNKQGHKRGQNTK